MSNSISLNSQNPPSYLAICESELDPTLPLIYEKEYASLANQALIYAVVFPLITAMALFVANTVAPIFLIITGFTALHLVPPVKKIYSDTVLQSELKKERVNQLKSLKTHYENLANATTAQIHQMLKERGIDFVIGMGQNDARLTTLKPVLARHLFWEERISQLKESQEKTLRRADKLAAQNAEQNQDAISALHCDALNIENQVVAAKVKCAFVNAALFHPDCKGRLEDLGTFSILTGQERAIALRAGAAKANDFFTFNQPNLSAITFEDAKHRTIRQLGMYLYPNMQR